MHMYYMVTQFISKIRFNMTLVKTNDILGEGGDSETFFYKVTIYALLPMSCIKFS